jgi:hypothetical protein
MPSFENTWRRWLLTVWGDTKRRSATSRFVSPFGDEAHDVEFRRRQRRPCCYVAAARKAWIMRYALLWCLDRARVVEIGATLGSAFWLRILARQATR